MPIVQSATAYDNPETGETTILIFNKDICMRETMDHTLVNPNQLCAYGMTVQYNPFAEATIFIAMEDNYFMLQLSSKGDILGVTTRTPTYKELHTCPHVTFSSAHEWYPQNVRFPKILCTVKEETSRNIVTVMKKGKSPDLTDTDSDRNSVDQIHDIGAMTS